MKSLINHFDDSFPLFVYKHMPVLCHCIFPCFNCFKAFFFLYNCSWLVMWACRIIHKLLHIIHMHIFSVIHNRVFLILKERKPKKKETVLDIFTRVCVELSVDFVGLYCIRSWTKNTQLPFSSGDFIFGGFVWWLALPVMRRNTSYLRRLLDGSTITLFGKKISTEECSNMQIVTMNNRDN